MAAAKGRAKSWTGPVEELAQAIEPAARGKCFFVKPVEKGDKSKWQKLLANRDMWIRLRALHSGLAFKAGDVEKALTKVLGEVKASWKGTVLTVEMEADWVAASAVRLRGNARLIAVTLRSHPDCKNVRRLFSSEPLPDSSPGSSAAAADEGGVRVDDEEEEEEEEDEGGEEEEEGGEPDPVEADESSIYPLGVQAADGPVASLGWLSGFEWGDRVAWRMPSNMDASRKETVGVDSLFVPGDGFAHARWADGSSNRLPGVHADDVEQLKNSNVGACVSTSVFRFKRGSISVRQADKNKSVRLFLHLGPHPEEPFEGPGDADLPESVPPSGKQICNIKVAAFELGDGDEKAFKRAWEVGRGVAMGLQGKHSPLSAVLALRDNLTKLCLESPAAEMSAKAALAAKAVEKLKAPPKGAFVEPETQPALERRRRTSKGKEEPSGEGVGGKHVTLAEPVVVQEEVGKKKGKKRKLRKGKATKVAKENAAEDTKEEGAQPLKKAMKAMKARRVKATKVAKAKPAEEEVAEPGDAAAAGEAEGAPKKKKRAMKLAKAAPAEVEEVVVAGVAVAGAPAVRKRPAAAGKAAAAKPAAKNKAKAKAQAAEAAATCEGGRRGSW